VSKPQPAGREPRVTTHYSGVPLTNGEKGSRVVFRSDSVAYQVGIPAVSPPPTVTPIAPPPIKLTPQQELDAVLEVLAAEFLGQASDGSRIFTRPAITATGLSAEAMHMVGRPGGIIQMSHKRVLLVGDLHGNDGNAQLIADSYGEEWAKIYLGDAVHRQRKSGMNLLDASEWVNNMDSSIATMDMIVRAKYLLANYEHYLKGNHDSFAPGLVECFVDRGLRLREVLVELRGEAYVQKLERFWQTCPRYIIVRGSQGVTAAAHVPIVRGGISTEQLINYPAAPVLAHCHRARGVDSVLEWGQAFRDYFPEDVLLMDKMLGLPATTVYVGGHTPKKGVSAYKVHDLKDETKIIPRHVILDASRDDILSVVEVCDGQAQVVDLKGNSGLAGVDLAA